MCYNKLCRFCVNLTAYVDEVAKKDKS